MKQINFRTLLGEEVVLFSGPSDPPSIPSRVTVRGVDCGGIWVEFQDLTDAFLKGIGKTMAGGTPIAFIPFWKISAAFAARDVPAISSEGIGQ